MELEHFSHKHPLILKEVQKEGEGDECFCFACEKVILDSAYNCGDCSYFLHKSCAKLLQDVKHYTHPEHFLTLLSSSPYSSGGYGCDVCHKIGDRFNYFCSLCKFNICVSCFISEHEITHEVKHVEREIRHEFHKHPLAPIFRPTSFFCDVCRTKSEDMSYICFTCQFLVHKSCLSLPKIIDRNCHRHSLTVIYRYSELSHFNHDCGICRLHISKDGWAYCCTRCRYFIHVRCSINTPESLRGGESENEVDQSIDPNLLHLPVTDGSLELFRHFAKQINFEDIEREAELIHWSHEHPLILFDVQKDDDIKDEITLCDGCVQPISFPFYRCDQCNYFLHLSCVNLPQDLQHPIHDEHPMKLCRHTEFYHTFQCGACFVRTNGFFYQCDTCKFILDVKCAFLPTSIAHQAHKHPLVQMQGSENRCKACDFNVFGSEFKCDDCKFKIGHKDALLPRTIRHRWDKHPLTLCYPLFYDHPDEFHCEMCEDEINPNHWIYHCSDCDQSFHLGCLRDIYSNVKYGGTIEVNCHPHLLTFVRKARKRSSYCSCGHSYVFEITNVAIDRPIFECGECNYTLCLNCVASIEEDDEIVCESSGEDEETVDDEVPMAVNASNRLTIVALTASSCNG